MRPRRRSGSEAKLGNVPARLFRELQTVWHLDATHHRIDVLASELAAQVGRAPAPLCLGLIRKEAIPRVFGLVFLLDGFGLTLRQRYRDDRASAYLFLERKGEVPSEYAGATVREVGRESAPEVEVELPVPRALPQAA